MAKKKVKRIRLSDIKFDKNKTIKGKKLDKVVKKLKEKLDEIDEKRKVDFDKLTKTYINI